jgi:hypothetical protein
MQVQFVIRRLRAAVGLGFLLFSIIGCAAPVRVEWSTETEMNTAGFNIYRGESPDGPFDVKINDQIIAASPDPMTGGKYAYVDNTAQIGKLYYYQLEEVEKTGTVNKVGITQARAGGFDWRLGIVLGGLAVAVLLAWVLGGKRVAPPHAADSPEKPKQ